MTDRLAFGRFELRPSQRLLLRDGTPCRIGGRAFDVLLVLLQHRHRTVTQQELLEQVWPNLAVEPNNLQVQVCALRKLLGRQAILTVARRGYRCGPAEAAATPAPAPPRLASTPPTAEHAAPPAPRQGLRWNPRVGPADTPPGR